MVHKGLWLTVGEPLIQVKNDKVQLSPKRAKINKNQNPDHVHTFNICTPSQQSENFQ